MQALVKTCCFEEEEYNEYHFNLGGELKTVRLVWESECTEEMLTKQKRLEKKQNKNVQKSYTTVQKFGVGKTF